MNEEEINKLIDERLSKLIKKDRYTFNKLLQLLDERNIQVGKTTGTKIGTETSQKIGFYNTTPVDQGDSVSDPTGGAVIDTEARSAINALIDRLQDIGIIA